MTQIKIYKKNINNTNYGFINANETMLNLRKIDPKIMIEKSAPYIKSGNIRVYLVIKKYTKDKYKFILSYLKENKHPIHFIKN